MGIILKHSFRRYKSMRWVRAGESGGGTLAEGGGGWVSAYFIYMLFRLAPWKLIRYTTARSARYFS